jgi:protein-L-isoaspartate(D-aspartate) O-methyltransferase
MIEQQIRTWDVLDENVLALYDQVLREDFIADEKLKPLAYAEMELPIAEGQTLLEPKLEARLLQELAPGKTEHILHVGAGSGFFATLLGLLAGTVVSAEIRQTLATAAAERIRRTPAGGKVSVVCADAVHGYAAAAPYDAIVLTGSTPLLSDSLAGQLNSGGRVLAVVGSSPAMRLCLYEKLGAGLSLVRSILEVDIPPLDNAPHLPRFQL